VSELETSRPPRAINLPNVVLGLVGLLLAIYLGLQALGESWQDAAYQALAFDTLIPQRWWTFATYGLLHANFAHVGTNCLWLVIFSKPVEGQLGAGRYLVLFWASVVGGAVLSLLLHVKVEEVLVGASAGVSGLLGAAIPVMYGAPDELRGGVRPLLPVEVLRSRRAMTFLVMWLGLTLFTAASQHFGGNDPFSGQLVAWDAHLGGFLTGFVLFYLLNATRNKPPLHTLH